MNARVLVIIFYIGSLIGSGAVISLLIAAFVLHWLGQDAFGRLIGSGIQVGAALCVLSIGLRLTIATWLWVKMKMAHSHG